MSCDGGQDYAVSLNLEPKSGDFVNKGLGDSTSVLWKGVVLMAKGRYLTGMSVLASPLTVVREKEKCDDARK